MEAKPCRVWPGTEGGVVNNPPFSPAMEFVDLSWVCFPDCGLAERSQTGLPITNDMEASKLTCLVSQSRRFQACFTLSTRQELTAFSEDCQDDQLSMHLGLVPVKAQPEGSAQSRRIPKWLMDDSFGY